MDDEVQLISDGDGIAVIGNAAAVERFLAAEGLRSRDMGLARLGNVLATASGTLQAGAEAAAQSGRWVKLTEESSRALRKFDAMKGSTDGVSRAIVMDKGKTKGILEFVKTGPATLATNPAMLAGAAGIMAQLAMQQTMDEITDYLAEIDEKVEDVLRAQKDAVLADMIGVDFVIEDAMAVRTETGRVSETTWSKVQATSMTIARTQGYALRQVDALASKLEQKSKMGEIAKVAGEAEATVQEWLAVLARCFQLQDAIAVLELDRVLDASPEELEEHRVGLQAARKNRLELISRSTEHLLARLRKAANTANTKVLLHPASAQGIVRSTNHVSTAVVDFHGVLGIDRGLESLEAKRWREAAGEARDKVLETGAEGAESVLRLGSESLDRARSVTGRLSGGIKDRARLGRRSEENAAPDED